MPPLKTNAHTTDKHFLIILDSPSRQRTIYINCQNSYKIQIQTPLSLHFFLTPLSHTDFTNFVTYTICRCYKEQCRARQELLFSVSRALHVPETHANAFNQQVRRVNLLTVFLVFSRQNFVFFVFWLVERVHPRMRFFLWDNARNYSGVKRSGCCSSALSLALEDGNVKQGRTSSGKTLASLSSMY